MEEVLTNKAAAVAAKLLGRPFIPPMTDPMGKHWDQPDLSQISFDENYDHALMSQKAFDELLDYSNSQPSGVYVGKMWKTHTDDGVYRLHWFGFDPDPKYCSNHRIKIKIV